MVEPIDDLLLFVLALLVVLVLLDVLPLLEALIVEPTMSSSELSDTGSIPSWDGLLITSATVRMRVITH